MFLRKVGIYLQVRAALEPRRTTSTSSLPSEPQISFDGKIPFGRHRHKLEDNIKMYHTELGVTVWTGFNRLKTGPNGGL
jgi:hypothetical protein